MEWKIDQRPKLYCFGHGNKFNELLINEESLRVKSQKKKNRSTFSNQNGLSDASFEICFAIYSNSRQFL